MKEKEERALRLAGAGVLVGDIAGAMGMDLQQFYRYRRKHCAFDRKIRRAIRERVRCRRRHVAVNDPLFSGAAPDSHAGVTHRAKILQKIRAAALVQRNEGPIY